MFRTREDARDYIARLSKRRGQEQPSVKRWRVAGRIVLLVLLGYSILQYYLLTILVHIVSLPTIVVFTRLILR